MHLAFGALLLALFLYVIHLVVVGSEPVYIAVSCSVLCVLFAIFAFFCLNPDMLRSRYTEETLFVASNMLDDLKEGLTAESAQKICERLLPQTRACSIAITDRPKRACLRGATWPMTFRRARPSTRRLRTMCSSMV